MISALRNRIAASVGRALFRRAIRGAIPEYVHRIRAVEHPIPRIRPNTWPLVVFACRGPFERDLMVTGWKEFTDRGSLALVHAMVNGTGLNPGHAYTRWLADEKTQVWVVLDLSGDKGCFYMTGI